MIITGFSGAGKSTAMNVFEDAGYFCVDNLPPGMIGSLIELFVHEGSKVERAAVVCDVRGGEYFDALTAVLDDLERRGARHRVLFLDAEDQTLLNRYKETRRRHPLAPGGSIAAGIAAERAQLDGLQGARRRRDRHDRADGGAPAQQDRRRLPLPAARRRASRSPSQLRLQARSAARRRPALRRPLPAQPALRARAARR